MKSSRASSLFWESEIESIPWNEEGIRVSFYIPQAVHETLSSPNSTMIIHLINIFETVMHKMEEQYIFL